MYQVLALFVIRHLMERGRDRERETETETRERDRETGVGGGRERKRRSGSDIVLNEARYLSGERSGTLSTFFGKMNGWVYELGQLHFLHNYMYVTQASVVCVLSIKNFGRFLFGLHCRLFLLASDLITVDVQFSSAQDVVCRAWEGPYALRPVSQEFLQLFLCPIYDDTFSYFQGRSSSHSFFYASFL